MHVSIGDRLVVRSHRLGEHDRSGVVLSVEGHEGDPPYHVRWDDGHESIYVPGTDALVEHLPALR